MRRPLPRFSDDEVVDFQVAEAIVIRADNEQREAQEARDATQQREQTGLAGHRDDEFLERARAAE